MAIGPSRSGLRLDLRQSQSLVMTPQLRQAIKLLQSSNLEVAAFVEEELERNPLLERAEEGGPEEAPVAPVPEEAPPQAGDWLADDIAPERADIEAGRLVPLLLPYTAEFPGFALSYARHRHRSAAVNACIAALRASARR